MDHPQITHVSLCAGYGGIDLGLHRCIPHLRTIAYSEIEAFACELLLARMESGSLDAAPIWPDLKSFPWEKLRDRVDILSGGYPCQPFSSAGKRLGREDPRHIWPYIADGIRILQPALCFFENVEGHISLGLREVIEHLGELGYAATWGIFSAAEVGAPHQRKRVFILAHRSGAGLPRHWGLEHVGLSEARQTEEGCAAEGGKLGSAGILWPSRPGQPQFRWEPPRVVGSNGENFLKSLGWKLGDSNGFDRSASTEGRNNDAKAGHTGRRQIEPALGRNADGPSGGMGYAELCVAGDSRVDELRLLGNGVVPAVAERAFVTLLDELLADA